MEFQIVSPVWLISLAIALTLVNHPEAAKVEQQKSVPALNDMNRGMEAAETSTSTFSPYHDKARQLMAALEEELRKRTMLLERKLKRGETNIKLIDTEGISGYRKVEESMQKLNSAEDYLKSPQDSVITIADDNDGADDDNGDDDGYWQHFFTDINIDDDLVPEQDANQGMETDSYKHSKAMRKPKGKSSVKVGTNSHVDHGQHRPIENIQVLHPLEKRGNINDLHKQHKQLSRKKDQQNINEDRKLFGTNSDQRPKRRMAQLNTHENQKPFGTNHNLEQYELLSKHEVRTNNYEDQEHFETNPKQGRHEGFVGTTNYKDQKPFGNNPDRAHHGPLRNNKVQINTYGDEKPFDVKFNREQYEPLRNNKVQTNTYGEQKPFDVKFNRGQYEPLRNNKVQTNTYGDQKPFDIKFNQEQYEPLRNYEAQQNTYNNQKPFASKFDQGNHKSTNAEPLVTKSNRGQYHPVKRFSNKNDADKPYKPLQGTNMLDHMFEQYTPFKNEKKEKGAGGVDQPVGRPYAGASENPKYHRQAPDIGLHKHGQTKSMQTKYNQHSTHKQVSTFENNKNTSYPPKPYKLFDSQSYGLRESQQYNRYKNNKVAVNSHRPYSYRQDAQEDYPGHNKQTVDNYGPYKPLRNAANGGNILPQYHRRQKSKGIGNKDLYKTPHKFHEQNSGQNYFLEKPLGKSKQFHPLKTQRHIDIKSSYSSRAPEGKAISGNQIHSSPIQGKFQRHMKSKPPHQNQETRQTKTQEHKKNLPMNDPFNGDNFPSRQQRPLNFNKVVHKPASRREHISNHRPLENTEREQDISPRYRSQQHKSEEVIPQDQFGMHYSFPESHPMQKALSHSIRPDQHPTRPVNYQSKSPNTKRPPIQHNLGKNINSQRNNNAGKKFHARHPQQNSHNNRSPQRQFTTDNVHKQYHRPRLVHTKQVPQLNLHKEEKKPVYNSPTREQQYHSPPQSDPRHDKINNRPPIRFTHNEEDNIYKNNPHSNQRVQRFDPPQRDSREDKINNRPPIRFTHNEQDNIYNNNPDSNQRVQSFDPQQRDTREDKMNNRQPIRFTHNEQDNIYKNNPYSNQRVQTFDPPQRDSRQDKIKTRQPIRSTHNEQDNVYNNNPDSNQRVQTFDPPQRESRADKITNRQPIRFTHKEQDNIYNNNPDSNQRVQHFDPPQRESRADKISNRQPIRFTHNEQDNIYNNNPDSNQEVQRFDPTDFHPNFYPIKNTPFTDYQSQWTEDEDDIVDRQQKPYYNPAYIQPRANPSETDEMMREEDEYYHPDHSHPAHFDGRDTRGVADHIENGIPTEYDVPQFKEWHRSAGEKEADTFRRPELKHEPPMYKSQEVSTSETSEIDTKDSIENSKESDSEPEAGRISGNIPDNTAAKSLYNTEDTDNRTKRACFECGGKSDESKFHDGEDTVEWDRCRYAFHESEAADFGIKQIQCMDNCYIKVDKDNRVERGCYQAETGVTPDKLGCHKQGPGRAVYCFCHGDNCNSSNAPNFF